MLIDEPVSSHLTLRQSWNQILFWHVGYLLRQRLSSIHSTVPAWGSPAAKALCFHCGGAGLIPGQGTKASIPGEETKVVRELRSHMFHSTAKQSTIK